MKKRGEKVDGFKVIVTEYLNNKKISLLDFFYQCDKDKDGLLNFIEF